MNCLSTHDTKKSEDISSNLIALSEAPTIWSEKISYWSEINKKICEFETPDKNIEYIYYMLLLSSHPISLERILFQVKKAYCDGDPSLINSDDLQNIEDFIRKTYNHKTFIEDIAVFSSMLKKRGRSISLSRTFLKLLSHGVPDTYQGTEIWDNSLADPDNRRAVDFEARNKILNEVKEMNLGQIKENIGNGHLKLWLNWRILNLKKEKPELFDSRAKYNPIYASGGKSDLIISFVRGKGMIALTSRTGSEIANTWGETKISLPKGQWRNFLSDDDSTRYQKEALVADLLADLPLALLVRF